MTVKLYAIIERAVHIGARRGWEQHVARGHARADGDPTDTIASKIMEEIENYLNFTGEDM